MRHWRGNHDEIVVLSRLEPAAVQVNRCCKQQLARQIKSIDSRMVVSSLPTPLEYRCDQSDVSN